MRYRELGIHTLRAAPARAKSNGIAMLMRAGFLQANGEPTPLGQLALRRLGDLEQALPDLLRAARLSLVTTSAAEVAVESPAGTRYFLRCRNCGYASTVETARFRKPQAPAEAALPLERVATPQCTTIDALAQFLGVGTSKTAKALMYTRPSDGQFAFVVIRGDTQISEKKLAEALGVLRPATPQEIESAGAVPGYASPIGVSNALVVVDDLVPASANLVAGANQTGYHIINTNYGRDYVAQLVIDLAQAHEGDGCPECGTPMALIQGFVLARGGVNDFRTVLIALAEAFNDEYGLCLPAPLATFGVYLMHIPSRQTGTLEKAEELYPALMAGGLSVLFDDRDERAGVKFTDADLIGCPVRVTIAERNLKDGMVEFKFRSGGKTNLVRFQEAASALLAQAKTAP